MDYLKMIEPKDPDIGKKIKNKYKILDKIGGGAYGKVYLAEEIETKKQFAIKKSKKNLCISFDREIKALNKLSEYKKENKISKEDSYTIDMIDNFDEEKKTPEGSIFISYIVFEYKQKYNLFDYFIDVNKTIKERYAKLIFYKILKGVQEIHKAGLCHLDLKSKNILLDDKYKPIICDFGFATEYSSQLEEYRGTPGYADPVIFKFLPFDGIKADIFSLGVILLSIVARKRVFFNPGKFCKNDETYKDRYYQKIKDNDIKGYWELLDVESLNLSKEFKTLYINMVSDIPEKRPSIKEIINDPWMIEVTDPKLTDEEKKELEDEVFKEFEERKDILDNKYKKNIIENTNNLNNKKEEVENTQNKSTTKEEKNAFNENLKINEINEYSNINMKYYFKIIGAIKPHIFMNKLLDILEGLKKIYSHSLFVNPYEDEYKIDVKLEYDNDEIPEELIGAGFGNFEEYINAFHLEDIKIRIKLFKSNDGYLIRVFKKEGDFEIYHDLIEDIMRLIKKLF